MEDGVFRNYLYHVASTGGPVRHNRDTIRMTSRRDGTRTWAKAVNPPEKSPVIFIHGLLCSSLNWVKQHKQLLDNIYMIKYEGRGKQYFMNVRFLNTRVHGGRSSNQSGLERGTFLQDRGSSLHMHQFKLSSLGGFTAPDASSRFVTSPFPLSGHHVQSPGALYYKKFSNYTLLPPFL
ncbi:uncharacterized protein EV420DRAFT_1484578 [Desarmillaria tabescens]|uniref:Uncharacterized protein n=1 Tax=Armillaria tabescens TaxID=1929756 RepID=A0AA39JLD7_ARMTA|nr:uncharacterized protein EV420DRAFT_1484578 [Desarmillaria tabescens]KAK0444614.1 hypothetical protein EV420DRAFT_1484578 [Desarmillaria tabescens]